MRVSRWMLCAVALTLPAMLAAGAPAEAQVLYRQWSYHGPVYDRPPAYVRPAPLPPREIAGILADDYRYRRVGQPQFAGHMYVVDGIDRTGSVVRSYVDAFNGRLIDVDVLQSAPRQAGPGTRIARLPDAEDKPRALPTPPRRPSEARPDARPDARPAPRQAARPPATAPVAPPPAAPLAAPPDIAQPSIVPLSREPRVVNPAEVRVPDEIDNAPPMARPSARAQDGPGLSQMVPAPLDDAVRAPGTLQAPAVPVAPLL
jgi:hypothetical protein